MPIAKREPSLRDVQRWMRSRISPHDASGTPMQTPGGLLRPQRGTPGNERLAVYAEGYRVRMREALLEMYPAVAHVLGDQAFGGLAQGYATRHPSRDYNLSMVGRHLPEFLATAPSAESLPFLADLAALEWLVCQAFHAFEQPPVAPDAFASLAPERADRLTLCFQPSVGLVASRWPILDVWESRRTPHGQINIDLADRPQRVLVARAGLQVRCELLDAPQYALLEGLRSGRTLGEACAALAPLPGVEALPIAAWFTRWVHEGLITGRGFAA